MRSIACWNRSRPRRSAFTLIELLVVITVMSILAAILLPAIYTALSSSKTEITESLVAQIGVAIEQFQQERLVYPMGHAISARALPIVLGDRLKGKESFLLDSNGTGEGDLLVDAWGLPFVYVRRVPDEEADLGTDPSPTGTQLTDANGKIFPLHNSTTYDFFSAGALAHEVIGLNGTTDTKLAAYQSKCLEVSDNRRYTYDGYMRGQAKNKYLGNW